jgi:hypothetical protein
MNIASARPWLGRRLCTSGEVPACVSLLTATSLAPLLMREVTALQPTYAPPRPVRPAQPSRRIIGSCRHLTDGLDVASAASLSALETRLELEHPATVAYDEENAAAHPVVFAQAGKPGVPDAAECPLLFSCRTSARLPREW